VVTIQEIAQRHGIPLKYLEQILLMLKNAGILKSRRGIKGGYQLNRAPDQITVGDVLRVVDGKFAESGGPDTSEGETHAETFGLNGLWQEIRLAVEDIVDHATFDELQKRSRAAMAAQSHYTYSI